MMGRFTCLREIARGTFGTIHEARDNETGEIVALKILDAGAGVPKKETVLNHRINHRGVIRTHNCVFANGAWCVTMELADGPNLEQYIEQSGPLSAEAALDIILPLVDAARAVHAAGVVHRDIKPSNILRHGADWKLADFGQACEMGTPMEPGQKIGTSPYAPPEQTAAGRLWDARADIHAIGVVLCELLRGEITPPDTAIQLPNDLPFFLEQAILGCIDLNPDRRFDSADKLIEALAMPQSVAEPVIASPEPARRRYSRLTLGITAVAIGVLFAVLAYVRVLALKAPVGSSLPPARSEAKAAATRPAVDDLVLPRRTIRRIAVLDFANRTGDKSFDSYAVAIPEIIGAELANLHSVALIDATGVYEATPREVGKAIAADAVVIGTFQTENNSLSLVAHVIDVGSGEQVASARAAQKPHQNLFALQGEVAKQLAAAIQKNLSPAEQKDLEAATAATHSAEAFQNMSRGISYLRQDLPQDALQSFDAAVAADPRLPGAHYYRAQALEKLNRLDEAIDALKAALPGAEHDRPLLWQWDFPGTGKHSYISAYDTAHQQKQYSLFRNETGSDYRKQVVYAEAADDGTRLYFVDLAEHSVKRQLFNDRNILFNTLNDRAYSDGKVTILTSQTDAPDGTTSAKMYAFSRDGARRWTYVEPPEAAHDLPLAGIVGNWFVVAMPRIHRLDVVDITTGQTRSDPNITIEAAEFPLSAATTKHGSIVMFKSKDTYRAVRLRDGKDAWTVHGIQSAKVSQLVTDKFLIIFEPERRILVVALETGKIVYELAIPQFVDNAHVNIAVSIPVVGALVQDDVLYVLSQDVQLYTINLRKGTVLWHTQLPSRFQSIAIHGTAVYLTTQNNELLVLDSHGSIVRRTPLPPTSVIVRINDDNSVVHTTNLPDTWLRGISSTGEKVWQFDRIGWESNYVKGLVTAYSSESRIYAVDPSTGAELWTHTGNFPLFVQVVGNRTFVLSRDGLYEYSTGPRKESISDRQVWTALAKLSLQKHDLDKAVEYASRAAELDPDYPELALVRAHIYATQKKVEQAGIELARYVNVVGTDSKEGKQALAELSREHQLHWQSAIDLDVVGAPLLIGNRIVSVGRRVLDKLHLLALDARDGTVVWRWQAERFVASVAGTHENKYVLWYVSGDANDYTAITLSRIDILGVDQKLIVKWRKPARIEQAWAAAADGRVFVATVSVDAAMRTVDVGIDAIDLATERIVWANNVKITNATAQQLGQPVTGFAAGKGTLTYVVGSQRATVLAATGKATTGTVIVDTEPSYKIANDTVAEILDPKTGKIMARHPILWRPFVFRIENGAFYAFTFDGRAYGLNP